MPDANVYAIEALIFVAAAPDSDPEEIAMDMNAGLTHAIEGFPSAEVLGSDVSRIRKATDEEVKTYYEEG